MSEQMCFADPTRRFQPIDLADDLNGVLVSRISKETYEQILEWYPAAVVMPMEEAWKLYVDSSITPVREITEEDFWYFLEVLPPYGWIRGHDSESFYMSEFTNADVTLHLVRIGTRYFKFEDHVMRDHDKRVQHVLASFPDAIL